MKRNYASKFSVILALATLLLLSGCYIEVPDTTAVVEPAGDQQALEEEVKAAILAYEEAYEAGDVERLMTLYADDVVSIPPGYPMVQGKEAVEAGYRDFFAAYTLERDFNILDLEVHGNTASRLMEWTNVWTPREDGETITEVGHCVFDYEKIDGEWKVTREIWNMEEVTVNQVSAAAPVEEAADESRPKFYTSHGAHENLGMIDLASGAGTHIGPYQHPDLEIARTAWFALNGAVYENDFYTIVNKRLPAESEPAEAEARLARVDMQTGELTLLGEPINLNLGGLEISACGEVFAGRL